MQQPLHEQTNPYQSPPTEPGAPAGIDFFRLRGTVKQRIAGCLALAPLVLAMPIRYWVFHHAGSWFVSTQLGENHRLTWLGIMYIPLMASITVCFWFSASLLLWSDRWRSRSVGLLTALLGVLLIPALLWLGIGFMTYLEHG